MNDYISRQVAIDGKIPIQLSNGVEIYYDEAVPVGYLKHLSSADVVEVVRCKDCKAWSRYGDTVIGYCDLSGINWHDNDFCCYGERKEDDQTNDLR